LTVFSSQIRLICAQKKSENAEKAAEKMLKSLFSAQKNAEKGAKSVLLGLEKANLGVENVILGQKSIENGVKNVRNGVFGWFWGGVIAKIGVF
jgi:ribosomal protein L22